MEVTVGDRLKMFRLGRAMSLDELAAATDGLVTKQAISKYERGLMFPSPTVLNVFARFFGVKAAELLAPPSVDVHVLAFRRTSRLAKKEQYRVENLVSRMLEQRVVLQEASGQHNGKEIPLAKYAPTTLEECEEIASEVRDSWSLGVDPIACVTDVLEEHHIHVLEIETENAFDGLAAVAKDKEGHVKAAAVVSRKGLAGERQRLNLAHELGHLVMRQSDTIDDEKAAFRFGAAFLAPAELVKRDVGRARRRVSLMELLLLKKKYGMSIQALIYRLSDLDIIGPSQATALWKQINARGWKKEEPHALNPETPQWSRRAAARAVAEGTLTLDEAEGILGFRTGESRRNEPSNRRDLMKLPMAERKRLLTLDAERARDQYLDDGEWISLLGGDLLPDE
ncbi:MAG: helix-turn-helix domain-containing protein [Acidobacteria bacterium]|nr:helix-turn-helix domain-containing protein [Acidobacteriota bacterium]